MNSMNRLTIRTSLVVVVALTCFVLLPSAPAVNPPPDGGYPGGNTAEGQEALFSLTTGAFNTAVGFFSLRSNVTNEFNTAIGAGALFLNTADDNTATGAGALLGNTTGFANTATGSFALATNTTGSRNTAVGRDALGTNITGTSNTAVGYGALENLTGGESNTAVGRDALLNNTGSSNTAIGRGALVNNTTGVTNIAIGTDSGSSITTASNTICIGFGVQGANVDDTTWIGNVFGVTTQSGMTAPVVVSNNGQLGTVASSERFKKDIVDMQKTSESILALRPVTIHYKTDAGNTAQFGLIAEEVAKVNPALVLPDKEGKPYTVRYDAVNAMLLNEFQKEHREVQELKTTVVQQQKQIEALTAALQRVSVQHELSKAASQTVMINQ